MSKSQSGNTGCYPDADGYFPSVRCRPLYEEAAVPMMAMPHTTTRKLSAFSSPRPVISVTSAGVGHADRPRGGRTNIITVVASGGASNPFKVTVSKTVGHNALVGSTPTLGTSFRPSSRPS